MNQVAESCPANKCDGSGFYAGVPSYGPCDCQLPPDSRSPGLAPAAPNDPA